MKIGINNKSRNLLWYFMRSKIWKKYLSDVTMNYALQASENPQRATMMLTSSELHFKKLGPKPLGIRIEDYICDMYNCVDENEDRLAHNTKTKLLAELIDLEMFHKEMGSLDEII